ncbi:MAG: hypothetical protein WBF79_09435, partial [Rhodococcus sp. (in: high G+C Gram-positive bacteria)]
MSAEPTEKGVPQIGPGAPCALDARRALGTPLIAGKPDHSTLALDYGVSVIVLRGRFRECPPMRM